MIEPARGWLVAVVGPDGVGKTSVARALCRRYEGPTVYVHFRPSLIRPLETGPPDQSKQTDKTVPERRRRWIGILRLVRSWILFWVGYRFRLRGVIDSGGLVVADRWAYGYVGQPEALGFFGPPKLAHLALRTMPAPDLMVNLVAPLSVISERKQELSPEQIAVEMQAYSQISVGRVLTLEATMSPDELASLVLKDLDHD